MARSIDFLHAIAAQPEEDAPRLIFADWLEEQGDTARAEFIRVQCQLGRMEGCEPGYYALKQREAKLYRAHGDTWSRDIKPWVRYSRFERGGIADVTVTPKKLEQHGKELFTLAPVQRVKLMMLKSKDIPVLVGLSCLRHVRSLSLGGNELTSAELAQLLDSPYLTQVQSLELEPNYRTESDLTFLTPGRLPQVRELRLTGRLSIGAWEQLCTSSWLGQVERLYLRGWLHNDRMQAFTDPTIPATERVLLALRPDDTDGLGSLIRSSGLGSLSTLSVDFSNLQDPTAEELAGCGGLGSLTRLELHSLKLSSRGLQALAGASFVPRLKHWRLHFAQHTSTSLDEGILALASAPAGQLRSLAVQNARFVSEQTLILLLSASWAPQVSCWDFHDCSQLKDAFAQRVLDTIPAGRLARLDLGGTRVSAVMQKQLRKHFGPHVCTFSAS